MSEQNNGLPETTLQESNYKHVTDLYLRNFIAPDSTQFAEGMTMLNSLTLSTIAAQCPYLGGNAVYLARSLIAITAIFITTIK